MRRLWPFLILIFLVTAVLGALFYPYLNNYFVADDFFHLATARFSTEPWSVWWRPYFFGRVFWRPMPWMAHFFMYRLAGLDPVANHLADVTLHGLDALMVSILAWLLLRNRIAERFWRLAASGLAGLLFAAHPIALLTASWLCCRGDLLGFFFLLLALILFLHFRGRLRYQGLAALCALLACLSKETMIVHPALILAAAWLFPTEKIQSFRRLARAARETLPFAAALGVYLGWRLSVLGQMGGYEPIRLSLSFFLPRLAYHLPQILKRVPRDLLFHHLEPASLNFQMLAAFFLLLLLGTGWGLLRRERRLLAFSLAWLAITLAPLWNLSQMLVQREERLLYLPLVGFLLLAPASLAALQRPTGRALALGLWILILAAYRLADQPALRSWEQAGEANRALSTALCQKLTGLKPPPAGQRFYILGLDADQYYLDPMLKLELPSQYLSNRFMLGDHPCLVWNFLPAFPNASDAEPQMDAKALPKEEIVTMDSLNHLVAVTPPDLLLVSQLDPTAALWEWKGGLVLDASPEIRNLAFQVPMMLGRYSQMTRFLPTWSFYRGGLALSWTLSPDCKADPLDRSEEALAFISAGPDPYLVSPPIRFHAAGAKVVEIELKLPRRDYLPPDQSEGSLFWLTEDQSNWSSQRELRFPLQADGQWHTYRLELPPNLAWVRSGLVRKLRLDPMVGPGGFWLRRVVFLSESEVNVQQAAAGSKPPASP